MSNEEIEKMIATVKESNNQQRKMIANNRILESTLIEQQKIIMDQYDIIFDLKLEIERLKESQS